MARENQNTVMADRYSLAQFRSAISGQVISPDDAEYDEALNHGDVERYVNSLGDEGAARVRVAYPGSTWDRLAAIKARYDPTNLFRLNQNIPPAN